MQLVSLDLQGSSLALGVDPLLVTTLLVSSPLLQIELPPHGVDVEGGAVGVEVEDLVDGGLHQTGVVGDHEDPARVGLQKAAQPDDGVGVQVVGRLVQEEGVCPGEQDARQLDSTTLTTGKVLEWLGQHAIVKSQVRRDPSSLGRGSVTASGDETVLRLGVLVHRDRPLIVGAVGHLVLQGTHPFEHVVQATGREDSCSGNGLHVRIAGVLRQVAEFPGTSHRTCGG